MFFKVFLGHPQEREGGDWKTTGQHFFFASTPGCTAKEKACMCIAATVVLGLTNPEPKAKRGLKKDSALCGKSHTLHAGGHLLPKSSQKPGGTLPQRLLFGLDGPKA